MTVGQTTTPDEPPTPDEYRVHFAGTFSYSATITATNPEEAIELAHEGITDLCAHCTGWGESWTREVGTDGLEFIEATCGGKVVETGRTMFDELGDNVKRERDKVAALEERLAAAQARIKELEGA